MAILKRRLDQAAGRRRLGWANRFGIALALVLLAGGVLAMQASCGPAEEAAMNAEEAAVAPESLWTSIGLSGGGGMFTPAISPHDPNLMLVNCDMSCAFRSADGGENWTMIHADQLQGSTRCRAAFHPNDPEVVFAVNGWQGQLSVSRDRGVTWEPVSEELPRGVLEVEIDPSNAQLMLAGLEERVYRSIDGGEHWSVCRGVQGSAVGLHFDQTSPTESRRCFAATDQGVFVSEDGGATWGQIGEGLPPRRLVDFTGGSDGRRNECVLYCSVDTESADGQLVGGIYRSTDRGRTWQSAMGEGIDTELRESWGRVRAPEYPFVLTTNVRPMTVYAFRGGAGQVYRSDDAGQSWRPTLFVRTEDEGFNLEPSYLTAETGGWPENLSGAGINPADPEMVVVTDWMCCQVTRDGGRTWDTLHTRPAPGQGPVGPGQRWENTGLTVTTVWHYYIDPFEPNRHYIAYTDIGYARSEDAGQTWYWQHGAPLRNTTYELAFDPETPGKIWAAFADVHDIPNGNIILGRHGSQGGGGVGISDDFGVTWRDTSEGLPGTPVISVVLDPSSPAEARVLYASVWEHGVYKSVDGGQTWVGKSEGLGAPEFNMRACRLILHEDGTLFCLITALRGRDDFLPNGVGLYRSRDGAESWEAVTNSRRLLWPKDYDVDPRDSNVIYLGAADAGRRQQGGLYKTTDGGESWERIARMGREHFGATVNPRRPDWVYMTLCESSPGPGLWLSKDGGETWAPFTGLPFRNVQRVAFDPADDSVIYVATFGGSVWKGPAEPPGAVPEPWREARGSSSER